MMKSFSLNITLVIAGILSLVILALGIKSEMLSSENKEQHIKVVELEAVNAQAPLEKEAAMIAAKALGQIDQIDKEIIDENITYDVGIFHYRFD